MAYNKGYDIKFDGYDKRDGTIKLSELSLRNWYETYFKNPGLYFYAYILDKSENKFVGDVNFHPSNLGKDVRDIGILIKDEYRNRGYGKYALKLLVNEAFSFKEISYLHNNFEKSRKTALKIHKACDLKVLKEDEGIVDLLVKKPEGFGL